MKIWKILIGICILFLIINTVAAIDENNLKGPSGYEEVVAGIGNNLEDPDVYIYVGDMEYNQDVFDNTSDYTVEQVDVGIYSYVDTRLNICGVQEKVKINGKEYLVSVCNDGSANGDLDAYLKDLKNFNNLNDLIPMTI